MPFPIGSFPERVLISRVCIRMTGWQCPYGYETGYETGHIQLGMGDQQLVGMYYGARTTGTHDSTGHVLEVQAIRLSITS